jgi:mannitol operon repressor
MNEPKKAFDDAEPEILDLGRFTLEFNQESDRGAALIAAARIDEVLKAILFAFLRDTKSAQDLLDGFNAPLGTFSARASGCHALGLIDDAEFADVTRIRKVRNAFGHEWKGIDFNTESIAAIVGGLPWRAPAEFEAAGTARQRFSAAVVLLLADLLWRERLVRGKKIGAVTWTHTTSSRG